MKGIGVRPSGLQFAGHVAAHHLIYEREVSFVLSWRFRPIVLVLDVCPVPNLDVCCLGVAQFGGIGFEHFPRGNRVEELEQQDLKNHFFGVGRCVRIIDHLSDKILAHSVTSPKDVGELVLL